MEAGMFIRKTMQFLGWLTLVLAIDAAADLPDFSEFAEKLSPAVVNISTTRTVRGGPAGLGQFGGNPTVKN